MAATDQTRTLSSGLLGLMTVITGVTVANIYYNQPLLNLMAKSFHVPNATLGIVTMLTQIGYATGLLIFVPLADFLERRRLIWQLLLVCATATALMSVAETLWWLELASFMTGLVSVVPQIILPLAADLADNRHRGRVVGIIMSGLLIGVLLARTVSGFVGGLGGWRLMFLLAAGFMLILTAISARILPRYHARKPAPFRHVLGSLLPLMRNEPELVRVSLTGASFFGAFSAFWTTLTFLLSAAPYHYPASTIGLFGLAGVAGALIAPVAGRSADRRDPRLLVSLAFLPAIAAFILAGIFSGSLPAILIAVVLLDLATNGAQISNQSRIYALTPEARARSNTIYMVFYFMGGALGSGLGSFFYHVAHMPGVASVAIAFLLLGIVIHRISLSRYSRPQRFGTIE